MDIRVVIQELKVQLSLLIDALLKTETDLKNLYGRIDTMDDRIQKNQDNKNFLKITAVVRLDSWRLLNHELREDRREIKGLRTKATAMSKETIGLLEKIDKLQHRIDSLEKQCHHLGKVLHINERRRNSRQD